MDRLAQTRDIAILLNGSAAQGFTQRDVPRLGLPPGAPKVLLFVSPSSTINRDELGWWW